MRQKILVIDGVESIYRSISKTLEKLGCTVDHCSTGDEGLMRANAYVFDLIIVEIHLPDTNGIVICKELKKSKRHQHLPVLLLTEDSSHLESGILAGASDYLLKPFREVELVARVNIQLAISKERLCYEREKSLLQQKITEGKTKLIHAQNDLYQYFYQTSHKLKSPISTMEGLIGLLQIEYPKIKDCQYLGYINETLTRIAYVNSQVAKIGELKYHTAHYSLIKLSEFLNLLMAREYESKPIQILIPDTILLNVDAHLLKNGLKPLIENAIYYASLESGKSKIKIYTKEIKDKCYLVIHDKGIGIKRKHIKSIGNMFFIANLKSRGNGLGLFISKIAFNRLGIKLIIKSKVNQFTKVLVDISHLLVVTNHSNQ